MQFLALRSNFCKPLKKKSGIFVRRTRFPRQHWLILRTNNGYFPLFFQSREQVVDRWGQIWRIGCVIKTMEAQVIQFLLGRKCPVRRGIVVQQQDPLVDFPRIVFFLKNILQLYQQRWVVLRVDNLALWKIINVEYAVLIQIKKSRREFFQRIFAPGIFFGGGGGEALCCHSIDFFLSLVHSDITRFRPWSPSAPDRKSFGSRRKNTKICLADWHRWRFWSALRYFGERFRMYKSSWMRDPTRSREMPSYSAIDLAEIQISSKITSWIWTIIFGVVTVLSLPGRGATQVESHHV